MKKSVFVLLLFILVGYSCNDSETNDNMSNDDLPNTIARISSNNDIVFVNKSSLKSQLENAQKKSGLATIKIEQLYIDVSKAVDDENVEIKQLIASNADGSIKIAYFLKENNGSYSLDSSSTILKCEGCRDGCSPRRHANGDGYCTKCVGDYQTCTKTETLEPVE
ncbi:hypothetical protein [Gaetbulibacter sp. PBL-D1]|uniref:hypothetical protein n=1 Tax=Gaetbulibacter sp. PBL-D1 TaxID=3422594 RepID=UPI003D2F2F75